MTRLHILKQTSQSCVHVYDQKTQTNKLTHAHERKSTHILLLFWLKICSVLFSHLEASKVQTLHKHKCFTHGWIGYENNFTVYLKTHMFECNGTKYIYTCAISFIHSPQAIE